MANVQLSVFNVQPRNGIGSISVPGVKVGDVLVLIFLNNYDLAVSPFFYFERVVTVANQIQQVNANNLSGLAPFHVYLAG